MITDTRPYVVLVLERVLKQMLVGGLPVVMASCGGATGALERDATTGDDAQSESVPCQPFQFQRGFLTTCGSGPYANEPPFTTVPPQTSTRAFDPNDPRWRDLYRACLAHDAGVVDDPSCESLCVAVNGAGSPQYLTCNLTCGDANVMTISTSNAVCGRRATSHRREQGCERAAPPMGRYWAHVARLEAESVPAFARLAKGLARHNAPASLIRCAHVAKVDEGRHWRLTRALARRRGANPTRPAINAAPFASLADLALDNIVEGCIRETLGAVVASHQATKAGDPEVRRLMSEIAIDEIAHANLAWQIDAWARKVLGPAFEARRRAAACTAIAELLGNLDRPADDEGVLAGFLADAGLPTREASRAMLGAAWTQLWEDAFATPSQHAILPTRV